MTRLPPDEALDSARSSLEFKSTICVSSAFLNFSMFEERSYKINQSKLIYIYIYYLIN